MVRSIYRDFLDGVPIRAIQRRVNENGYPEMSNYGIKNMLQNEVYKGDVIIEIIENSWKGYFRITEYVIIRSQSKNRRTIKRHEFGNTIR